MSGYVYAMGIEGTSLVKIGSTQDISKRLEVLQRGLPYTLVLLHHEQVEHPRRVEQALHDMLAVIRQRGEWFELPEVYFPSLFAQGIVYAAQLDAPHTAREERKMALTNAERQRRYRQRRQERQPPVRYRRPQDRRSRPQCWAEAVGTLRELQEAYQEWLDNLPENLRDSPLAEKLEAVCALDLDDLEVDLPLGFGRD